MTARVHAHPISALAGFRVDIILNLEVGRSGVSGFWSAEQAQHYEMRL